MVRVENNPKVILTQEEVEILSKATRIISDIHTEDIKESVYDSCDSCETGWYFIEEFLENLINISEIE